jgi:sterol desaturase/sphingolipid hydroxylase (fatty acid hydroxylase superfamily)
MNEAEHAVEHIAQISVYAIPAFLLLIAIEFLGYHRESRERAAGKPPSGRVKVGVSGRDAASSLSIYALGRVVKPLDKFIELPILAVASALTPLTLAASQWWVWPLALVLADLSYYAEHRMHHRIRLFWAAHSVHHSSQHFNMSTAVRLPWLIPGSFLPAVAYAPMALLGVPLWLTLLCKSIVLLYQFPLHTERIDKLPKMIEYVFNTPSHHRVHHGANNPYLDKNYGGILIIWDRLFGTHAEEVEPVQYGLTKDVATHNPIKLNYHEFSVMLRDIWRARTWRGRVGYLLRPPGWAEPGPEETGVRTGVDEPVLAARAD